MNHVFGFGVGVAGRRPALPRVQGCKALQNKPTPYPGRAARAPAPDYPRTHAFVWEGCVMNYEETYRRSID
ncbi:hypothetical protein, partial [Stenotrophomonas sp. A3_2]|uniref:hypothetical protein n=1 Tax=Stenotrophomonas sp. A3_2 TaxID=3119978 RepID=UPI002FC2DE8B